MEAVLAVLAGVVSGLIAGAFGVGGAILSTPAVQVLLGAPPIVAVGTTLPAIFPTSLTGSYAYHRAGEVDVRAVRWLAPPGAVASALGALATAVINPHWLLLTTAILIGWQAARVGLGTGPAPRARAAGGPSGRALAVTGAGAGFASGLLGIGGGVVLVPVMNAVLGMPLKRTLGTSLVVIAVMVVPGTVVHAILGHIDWAIFGWLTLGVVPGAAAGARWTIRSQERTVRIAVGLFLGAVAVAYAAFEVGRLLG
ncbi:MAG: sulfite exporter TauE/SafE family protein [Actinomycetota bacterium]